ncbi:G protein-coupled receptor gpr1 [Entomophthora muscae]|uniref:G protein-coupled receptor gpr1 n=1 Tax=Entomophthora muscae TaxID=34485 RepID=A0ACC2TBR3_9FUNG|nr:G protein-coupled receptor gpr1 [Entomophthora muscae]
MNEVKQTTALVLGCLGMASNGLLTIVLGRKRARWNNLNLQMVVSICVVDFFATFLVFIKEILSFSIGNRILFSSKWFCPYFGTLLHVLPCLSIVLISVMSLDRYRIVVHGFSIRSLWGWLIVLTVGGGASTLLIANTAINGLRTNPSFTLCHPDNPTGLTFAAHRIVTAAIVLGLAIVSFCYVGIYLHCRKNLIAFRKMSWRFLFILAAHHVCWLPKFVISLWEFFSHQKEIPMLLYDIGSLGLLLLFAINPLLVIGFQASLRKEVFSLLTHSSSLNRDHISSPTDLKPSEGWLKHQTLWV